MPLVVEQSTCLLKMPQSSIEVPSFQTSATGYTMRHTASPYIVMTLCFGEKLHRGPPLFGGFTADVVASPYSIKDGKPFRGVRSIVNQHLCPRQGLLGLGRRITAARDQCLTEHYFQFEGHLRGCSPGRKRSQQCKRVIQVSDGFGVCRMLDRALPGLSQVVDRPRN